MGTSDMGTSNSAAPTAGVVVQCANLKAYLELLINFSPVKQDVLHEHIIYEVWLPECCILLSLQESGQREEDDDCAVPVGSPYLDMLLYLFQWKAF